MAKNKQGARAVADLSAGEVMARVEIAVAPERVWRALTTEELTKWWGAPGERYRTTRFTMEPKVGGAWRTDGVGSDGAPFFVEGEVLTFEPPQKLAYTWRYSWGGDAPATRIVYTLDAIPTGTRVTVRHSGFVGQPAACDDHAQGWEGVLDWLAAYVAPSQPPRHFLCRLIPPRATFMADITEDERAVMAAHATYWQKLLAEGTALAFGPVADPTGGWGLGIVRAPDEAALAQLTSADPAITSGRGFRTEALPIVQLVY